MYWRVIERIIAAEGFESREDAETWASRTLTETDKMHWTVEQCRNFYAE